MHPERAGAFSAQDGESTAAVRERVAAAREAAAKRWQPHGIRTNAEVSGACCDASSGRSRRRWHRCGPRSTAACSASEVSTEHCGSRGRLPISPAGLRRDRTRSAAALSFRQAGVRDDRRHRRAFAYLSRVAEPPCPSASALVGAASDRSRPPTGQAGQVDDAWPVAPKLGAESIPRAKDLELLARMGGRLITADDDEWPLLAFAAFGGVDTRLRPQAHPPMVLWAVGPARLDDVAERAAAIVGTRAATAYGEHVAADLAAGIGRAGRGRGVGRRIRHRRSRAPRGAGRRRVHRRGAGRRRRCSIPRRAFRAVAPDRRGRTADRRVPARRASGPSPIPHPQPSGRRAGRCHGGRRGRPAQRRRQHRRVGRGAGPCRVCGAGPGDVVGVGRMPRVAAHGADLVTRAEDIVELVGRAGELAPDEQRPGLRSTVWPTPSSGSTTRCRPAAHAPPTRSPSPPACRPRRCWVRWPCWKLSGWWPVRTAAGNSSAGR